MAGRLAPWTPGQLNRAGWHAVVATNQPGPGAACSTVTLAQRHPRHDAPGSRRPRVGGSTPCSLPPCPAEDCTCRKPAPGLLEQTERYGRDAEGCVQVVGKPPAHSDGWRRAGCVLHLRVTASAHLAPGLPLPAGWPEGCVHADPGVVEHLRHNTRPWRQSPCRFYLTRRAPMTQRFATGAGSGWPHRGARI